MFVLTLQFEETSLLQQQVNVGEILRNEHARVTHEIEDVTEHASIAVDEVVLLERVQHDGRAAVEEARQLRVRKPATRMVVNTRD